ncbi:hypothetical protein [Mycobacterium sp. 1164966.3]|uniref:DUF7159 family protein n=1 Tax=Mycobacterium sp. 1164966.3 TaxID=1856861 RepID=UPI000A696481|nr:hypothetical protein [Mycobacterium sp. 1164966.3]
MVDIVLGVSMAPTKVRMVLVEGENADGVTVDQENFDVDAQSSGTAPAQVISAILGTRESAAEGGYQLQSSGVTWTDPVEAAALRDALAAHKVENVMLVSAFMSAAALAQAVGNATNYARTALLFVEPRSATLAVINSDDGSVSDVHRKLLPDDDDRAIAELIDLVSGAEALDTRPDGVFVVGSGVDIPLIKPALQAATSLTLSVPEEPEMALAQGAALASANSPLFASSTVARAYALDTGVDRPQYPIPRVAADNKAGIDNVAYSAVQDEPEDADPDDARRRSLLLVGSSLSVVVISAVVALEIALAISIRPTVALRPSPNENVIVPTQQSPAPVIAPKPEVKPPKPCPPPKSPRPKIPPPNGPRPPPSPGKGPRGAGPPSLGNSPRSRGTCGSRGSGARGCSTGAGSRGTTRTGGAGAGTRTGASGRTTGGGAAGTTTGGGAAVRLVVGSLAAGSWAAGTASAASGAGSRHIRELCRAALDQRRVATVT